jgi:hypothetical protein
VANFRVTGPYFSEGKVGCAVIDPFASYVEILWNFLTLALNHQEIGLSTIMFQQDGATAHIARASMEVIQEMFPEQIISLCGKLPWPAHLPDLSVVISSGGTSK